MQLTLWSVQGAVRRVEYAMFSVAYLCLVVVSSRQWKVNEITCFLFYYFTVIFKRWLPIKLYFQQETSDHFYWLVLTMGKRTTIYLAFKHFVWKHLLLNVYGKLTVSPLLSNSRLQCLISGLVFTQLAPRPIQSTIHNVRVEKRRRN